MTAASYVNSATVNNGRTGNIFLYKCGLYRAFVNLTVFTHLDRMDVSCLCADENSTGCFVVAKGRTNRFRFATRLFRRWQNKRVNKLYAAVFVSFVTCKAVCVQDSCFPCKYNAITYYYAFAPVESAQSFGNITPCKFLDFVCCGRILILFICNNSIISQQSRFVDSSFYSSKIKEVKKGQPGLRRFRKSGHFYSNPENKKVNPNQSVVTNRLGLF